MIKTHTNFIKKTIKGDGKGLRLGLGFFYFILNLPPLTRDVTCSVTLLGRKKHEEAMSDEHPLLVIKEPSMS